MASTQPIINNLTSLDGLKISTRSWLPPGKPTAIIAIVPGFNSYSAYYQWAADQLVAKNYAVYAVDLRGRGESDGERFYVENYDDYVNDVEQMIDLAKTQQPGLPVFLLGHSAGGVIACIYALDHQTELKGFICESFAHQVPAPDFVLSVLKGLSHVAPHAHVLKLKNEDFSRDPAVVTAMNNDPLIANESQPTKTMQQLVLADERLKKEFPLITLPIFILHGSLDKATKPSGSQFFYNTAGSKDKTIKIYEGHFHDLLNDVGKESVMTDIEDWVAAHV